MFAFPWMAVVSIVTELPSVWGIIFHQPTCFFTDVTIESIHSKWRLGTDGRSEPFLWSQPTRMFMYFDKSFITQGLECYSKFSLGRFEHIEGINFLKNPSQSFIVLSSCCKMQERNFCGLDFKCEMTKIREEETQLLFVVWSSLALFFTFDENDPVRFLTLEEGKIQLIVWKEPP